MINRYAFAGLLLVVAIAGIGALGYVVAAGGDERPIRDENATAADHSRRKARSGTPTPDAASTATPPRVKIKDLRKAAKAAGCDVVTAPDEGAVHVARDVTPADYGSNPPTSGMHTPVPAGDGIYAPGNTPPLGTLVHTLEHGRINVQYRPGTDANTIAQLTALFNEMDKGHHLLLYENQTDMPFAVAATAWRHLLGCRKVNDHIFDAIRAFGAAYVDEGPELVP